METLTKDDFLLNAEHYISRIKEGEVFIYPTDTIYGIGCIATNGNAVDRIRKLKGRTTNPFSVIIPSVKWINDNCVVPERAMEWLNKLPGPYTLIFRLKNNSVIAKQVNSNGTIGIRIPDHWIMRVLKRLNAPVVTTSVNVSGQEFMTSIENLDTCFENNVDFILYEGEKAGRPSTIIDFTKQNDQIIRR